MNIKNLESFKLEMSKIAFSPMSALNLAGGILGIKGSMSQASQASMNLGKKYVPMKLKPISSYTMESGQYSGIQPSGQRF
jgi:hypothetical protein